VVRLLFECTDLLCVKLAVLLCVRLQVSAVCVSCACVILDMNMLAGFVRNFCVCEIGCVIERKGSDSVPNMRYFKIPLCQNFC
jgi:hypothetical protein